MCSKAEKQIDGAVKPDWERRQVGTLHQRIWFVQDACQYLADETCLAPAMPMIHTRDIKSWISPTTSLLNWHSDCEKYI